MKELFKMIMKELILWSGKGALPSESMHVSTNGIFIINACYFYNEKFWGGKCYPRMNGHINDTTVVSAFFQNKRISPLLSKPVCEIQCIYIQIHLFNTVGRIGYILFNLLWIL